MNLKPKVQDGVGVKFNTRKIRVFPFKRRGHKSRTVRLKVAVMITKYQVNKRKLL